MAATVVSVVVGRSLARSVVDYEPLYTALQKIDVRALADKVEVPWYNQTLVQVGEVLVRLG